MIDEKKAEIRKAQAAYLKAWRKKNPDKVRSYNERYWEKRVLGGDAGAKNETARDVFTESAAD